MKGIFVVIVCGLLLLLQSSCQKEVDWTTPVTTNDSGFIKKFIVLDTTETPGADTVRIFDFGYDAQKRLSGYMHTIYNPGINGPGRLRAYYSYSYTYFGSDTFPARIIEDINDLLIPANSGKDTVYYFYQNGTVVKDSSGYADEYFVNTITRQSNTRTFVRGTIYDQLFGLSYDTSYVYTDWLNGNLLQQTDSLWMPIMGGFWDITDHIAQYDNKPNPFRRLVLPYYIPLNDEVFSFGLEGIVVPTTNNIIFYDQDGSTLTTSYQYRADGLPIISRDDDGAKCFYQYIRL